MSIRSILITSIIVLLVCFSGFAAGGGSVFAQAQSADSVAVTVTSKRGDINLDGSLDIMDLLSILGKITGQLPEEPSDDLNGDGKVNIFDLLALLREMAQLRDSGKQDLKALVKINSHLLCEPNVYIFYPIREFWPASEGGEMRARYKIHANREIERVEFILAGDTLYAQADTTPVLLEIDPDSQQTASGFAESELKEWNLKVWDNRGNCFIDSGQTRFSVKKNFATDLGGSPNTGLPIEFPLVLHGSWQRFGGIHPFASYFDKDDIFVIDLNEDGRDSVVFSNIDQLAESIMADVVSQENLWLHDSLRPHVYGPFVSSAVSRHTGMKSNRLIFLGEFPWSNGWFDLVPLDQNEKVLTELGFPKWIRVSAGGVYNNNYEIDPVVYEKYKK